MKSAGGKSMSWSRCWGLSRNMAQALRKQEGAGREIEGEKNQRIRKSIQCSTQITGINMETQTTPPSIITKIHLLFTIAGPPSSCNVLHCWKHCSKRVHQFLILGIRYLEKKTKKKIFVCLKLLHLDFCWSPLSIRRKHLLKNCMEIGGYEIPFMVWLTSLCRLYGKKTTYVQHLNSYLLNTVRACS